MANLGIVSWRELCQKASEEHNPQRLLALLREINHALAEQRVRIAEPPSGDPWVLTAAGEEERTYTTSFYDQLPSA